MKKIELIKMLEERLGRINNPSLIKELVKDIMNFHREDCNEWQALRFLKKRVDELWKVIKQTSEKGLVGERAKELKRVLDQIKPADRKPVNMQRSKK